MRRLFGKDDLRRLCDMDPDDRDVVIKYMFLPSGTRVSGSELNILMDSGFFVFPHGKMRCRLGGPETMGAPVTNKPDSLESKVGFVASDSGMLCAYFQVMYKTLMNKDYRVSMKDMALMKRMLAKARKLSLYKAISQYLHFWSSYNSRSPSIMGMYAAFEDVMRDVGKVGESDKW